MKQFSLILLAIIVVVAIILSVGNKKEVAAPSIPNDDTEIESPSESTPVQTETSSGEADMNTEVSAKTHTVTYTSSGFSPSSLTINAGDAVHFVNNTSGTMWVASDPHPMHSDYSEFDAQKGYASNTTYSFTFDEAGTYEYHDHQHASMRGTIIVK